MSLIQRRRLMMASGQESGDYIFTDYLEADGHQYIDTWVRANGETTYEVEFNAFQKASLTDTESASVFGCRTNASNRTFQLSTYKNGSVGWGDTTNILGFISEYGVRHTASLRVVNGYRYFYFDGAYVTRLYDISFTTPADLTLFANYEGGVAKERLIGRIYSLKLYKNGILVLDMVPAIRRVDKEPGMYDKVTDTFFTNMGEGSFVAGFEDDHEEDDDTPDIDVDVKGYVPDGLVALFDGIDKGGDSSAWIDRKSGIRMERGTDITETALGYELTDTGESFSTTDTRVSVDSLVGTIEVVGKFPDYRHVIFMPNISGSLALGVYESGIVWSAGLSQSVYKKTTMTHVKDTISISSDRCLVNGAVVAHGTKSANWSGVVSQAFINGRGGTTPNKFTGEIYCLRIYDRQLTEEEVRANQENDRVRFGMTF